MNQSPSENKPAPATREHDTLILGPEAWPQMLVGLLLSMAILGIGTTGSARLLIWLPPALFVGWIAVSYLLRSRPEPKRLTHEEMLAMQAHAKPKAETAVTVAKGGGSSAAKTEASVEKPAEKAAEKPKAAPAAVSTNDIVVLWGSETGNAEGLAEMAAGRLKDAGLPAQPMSMADMKLPQLAGCSKVLVITSTWGDGEPPSNAIDLWETLQKESVDLSNIRFSVLSLGDTAYPQFCQCGKDFDQFLENHGAKRIFPRRDCDLDYEGPFDEWIGGVTKAFQSQMVGV